MKRGPAALVLFAIAVFACIACTNYWRRKSPRMTSAMDKTPRTKHARSGVGVEYSDGVWNTSDNADLVRFIQDSWLYPPSGKKPNYDDRKDHAQFGQTTFVRSLLKDRVGGFFVECGAAAGNDFSNTIDLERDFNWTGLLVEADPTLYKSLVKLNRNAYSINACLSPSNRTNTMGFVQAYYIGGLLDTMDPSHLEMVKSKKFTEYTTVQCFPLYSILLALGRTHIDYFSLDVEGAELDILKTIPWHKISIDVLTVEYQRRGNKGIDKIATATTLQQMRELFRQTGLYKEVGILAGLDVVFKRIV